MNFGIIQVIQSFLNFDTMVTQLFLYFLLIIFTQIVEIFC